MKINAFSHDLFESISEQKIHHWVGQAVELAREAYENNNAEARAYVERLIFRINADHSFAAPLSSPVGLVWNILMKAKLTASITPYLNNGCRRLEDLQALLREAVIKTDREDHTWIDEILEESPYDHNFVVYTKNWFITAYGFCHQLISLAQHTNVKVERVVLSNVSDELQGTDHATQRSRFFKSICGRPFDSLQALEDPDTLTEAFALSNYRTGVCALPVPSYALGSFYSVEVAYVPSCERLLRGLNKHAFGDQDILDYVSGHGVLDSQHSEEWVDAIRAADLTEQDYECVTAGALAQLELRHRWFEAMRAAAKSAASLKPASLGFPSSFQVDNFDFNRLGDSI